MSQTSDGIPEREAGVMSDQELAEIESDHNCAPGCMSSVLAAEVRRLRTKVKELEEAVEYQRRAEEYQSLRESELP